MLSKSCIVLMPFRSDTEERFEFFRKCGKDLNLDVQRVDTYAFSGNIPTAIARALASADLVLADLSGANANVTYEVAIAQCMGQRLVLVTDDRNTVPFDLQGYRTELVPACTEDSAASLTLAMRQALSATYISGPLGGQPVFGQRVFIRRTFAFLVDMSGLIAVTLVASIPFQGWFGSSAESTDYILVMVLSLLSLTYYTLSTWRLGATLGQRALDLKVVDYDGKQLNFKRSLGRSVAVLASVLTYGVGYFWALHGPAYRTFHDVLSRSMVVRHAGKPKTAPV